MKRTDLIHIAPDQLVVEEGFNVRYDYGDIEGLAKSIFENGVKMPLRVYKDRQTQKYVIVDGHRRLRAVNYAIENLGADGLLVPIITEPKGVSDDRRVFNLLICNDGKSLTMLEEAAVYDRLVNYGWNVIDIAGKVGKSRTHIDNCLILLSASPSLKEQVRTGKVSASAVVEQLRHKPSDEVEKVIESAVKKADGKKVTPKHLKDTGDAENGMPPSSYKEPKFVPDFNPIEEAVQSSYLKLLEVQDDPNRLPEVVDEVMEILKPFVK